MTIIRSVITNGECHEHLCRNISRLGCQCLGGLALFLVGWGIYLGAGSIPYWVVAVILSATVHHEIRIKNSEHAEPLTFQFILGSVLFGSVLILVACFLDTTPAVHIGFIASTLVVLAGHFSIVFNHRLNSKDDGK